MTTFPQRYAAAATDAEPLALQLLFFEPPRLDGGLLAAALAPHLPGVSVELVDVADFPDAAKLLSADGPPASAVGLLTWDNHAVKVASFDAPMPYGPVESCVGPALIPPPMKVDAAQHQAHALLYYAGTHPDPWERFVALCAVAGAAARFDGIVVMNEEARSAVPAFDLIPDDGEDALATYRGLPIPYLFGGFVKMDTGEPEMPWVRTFANHRLGLPNFATKLPGHQHAARAFQLFAGMLGYLRAMGETFAAGDLVDLGDGTRFTLREPRETEWFLESPGTMLVIEPEG